MVLKVLIENVSLMFYGLHVTLSLGWFYFKNFNAGILKLSPTKSDHFFFISFTSLKTAH
jgi:hypothetical protein